MNDVQRGQCPCLRSRSQVFSLRTTKLRQRRPAPAVIDDVYFRHIHVFIHLVKSGIQSIRLRLYEREQDASLESSHELLLVTLSLHDGHALLERFLDGITNQHTIHSRSA